MRPNATVKTLAPVAALHAAPPPLRVSLPRGFAVRHGGDPVLGLAWRADGLLSAASNSVSSLAWAYDVSGLVTGETFSVGSSAFGVRRSFGPAALATNFTLSVESWTLSVERSFDPAGRLSSLTTPAGTFRVAYDGTNGLPSVVTNAAITCRYGYDLLGRLTNLTYATVGTSRVFRQWHDVSGAVTQRSVTVNNNALTRKWDMYAYDSLGRLAFAGKKSGLYGQVFTNRFGYDPAGNRLSVCTGVLASAQFHTSVYAYADNRLVSVTTNGAFASAVLHDAAGNVTGMVSRAGVRLSLAWNTQGQLVSVATNGAPAESYAYDPLGRRVRTASGTNVVFHVYDGDRCAADTDESGTPLRVYTWGPGIDDLLAMTVYTPGATNSYYAVKDHLGSVHALIASSGSVAASFSYDAWGNVSATINYSLLPVNFSCRFLFHGGEYSEATGLYRFRARWYSPDFGRWLSPDPLGLEGGLNLYEFCGNDPVNHRDPSGLSTFMPPGARNGEYIRFTDVSILLEPVTRYQHAQEIAHRVEEQYTGIDDFGDAMRHAEWSRQMTREIGLFRAWLYGTGHEMTGWFSQGNFEAMFMDLQNNSVGRSAGFYCQDVPVDDLVWIINAPPGHTPDYRDVNPAVIQPMLW